MLTLRKEEITNEVKDFERPVEDGILCTWEGISFWCEEAYQLFGNIKEEGYKCR